MILQSTLRSAEGSYRQIYDQHAPLMRFLTGLGVPLPPAFMTAAEFILNVDLTRAFQDRAPDMVRIRQLLREADAWKAQVDRNRFGFYIEKVVSELAEEFSREPETLARVTSLERVVDLAHGMPFKVDLSKAQNAYYDFRDRMLASKNGQHVDPAWKRHYQALGEKLLISPVET